ncbi:MAG: hypothetical protein M3O30_12935 [Planctomycetota bacterium]|nr:hypothetical protein [Planctomycetota bacterium]
MWRAPTIIAHRGLHDVLPENSLAAFQSAWSAGITWCECDVHLSADDVEVIIHDASLDRGTTGRGRVADFTWAKLSKIRLLGSDGSLSDQTIPSLDDVLAKMPVDCKLLIETKPALGARVLPIAEKAMKTGCGLQSFQIADMELAAAKFGDALDCAVLLGKTTELQTIVRSWNLDYRLLDAATLKRLRQQNIRIGAWTVNDALELSRLVNAGIDLIITDAPGIAQRVIADAKQMMSM